ncbi:MAG: aminofutalosine synthase MqnE, partial [Ferruginibacter sp.]
MSHPIDFIISSQSNTALQNIAQKVKEGIRISDEECLVLFEEASLGFVGALANYIREQKHG